MYKEFKPAGALAPYIDAYWQVTGEGKDPVTQYIQPDGCIDIIINLGDNFRADRNDFVMRNETAYLVGTMTRYKETTRVGDTHLVGIRFKPAAFTHFYRYASLHELTDTTVEFDRQLTPLIRPSMTRTVFTGYLDHWFMNRLSAPRDFLLPLIDEINVRRGQITVPELAQKHYISPRRLERLFKQHIGVSPKEFINFVRYQFALLNIRNDYATKSLLEIAFDSGYYDHSHLANEIKKYSGLAPSQL